MELIMADTLKVTVEFAGTRQKAVPPEVDVVAFGQVTEITGVTGEDPFTA